MNRFVEMDTQGSNFNIKRCRSRNPVEAAQNSDVKCNRSGMITAASCHVAHAESARGLIVQDSFRAHAFRARPLLRVETPQYQFRRNHYAQVRAKPLNAIPGVVDRIVRLRAVINQIVSRGMRRIRIKDRRPIVDFQQALLRFRDHKRSSAYDRPARAQGRSDNRIFIEPPSSPMVAHSQNGGTDCMIW